jgi:hypothetical protein
MIMAAHDDKPGEYQWGLAWATMALLAFGVLLLYFPHARWFGALILAGYLFLVRASLHRVRWSRSPTRTSAANRPERHGTSRGDRESE